MLRNIKYISVLLLIFVMIPSSAYSMHIMEGFLPPKWCVLWYAVSIPFLMRGLHTIRKITLKNPKLKLLIAMAGAFAFVLSSFKIPSITGSCSHPTGVGLGAILFGPTVMSVLGMIVLIFQALLLAHGGLTTLGANIFSMAIVGPIVSFLIYKLVYKAKGPKWLSVFISAALGNLMTYIVTSFQLAISFPSEVGGFATSFSKFLGIFAITQIPLAISEGILTVLIFNGIYYYAKDELKNLGNFTIGGI